MPTRTASEGRVTVACSHCRRLGSYSVVRLVERHGPDIPELDLLLILTQSCRHQHEPGSGKRSRYLPACLATIGLPPSLNGAPRSSDSPTPGGMTYTIETWDRTGGNVELHLATLCRADMAEAAFKVVCALWPDTEITVRQGMRILKHHNPPRADLPGCGSGS